jgi:hypothetical protein
MTHDPRKTVRANALDRAFELHNAEIGAMFNLALTRYHEAMVVPLAERIAYLERPLPVRMYLTLRQWWADRFQKDCTTVQSPEAAQ